MNLDFLQQLCTAWPGVTTDVKWDNDFVFSVAEKMFCICSLDPPLKIGFKVTDEEFEEVSVREGFMPAPYMARNKWVLVTNPGKLNRIEWESYVRQSYELVKRKLPKKMQEKLGEGTRNKVQGTSEKTQGTREKKERSSKVQGRGRVERTSTKSKSKRVTRRKSK